MPGYKVSIELGNAQCLQVGVCANSLNVLKIKLQEKFCLQAPVNVFLEDGTLVCDEDYFSVLEPQTKLVVRPALCGSVPHPRLPAMRPVVPSPTLEVNPPFALAFPPGPPPAPSLPYFQSILNHKMSHQASISMSRQCPVRMENRPAFLPTQRSCNDLPSCAFAPRFAHPDARHALASIPRPRPVPPTVKPISGSSTLNVATNPVSLLQNRNSVQSIVTVQNLLLANCPPLPQKQVPPLLAADKVATAPTSVIPGNISCQSKPANQVATAATTFIPENSTVCVSEPTSVLEISSTTDSYNKEPRTLETDVTLTPCAHNNNTISASKRPCENILIKVVDCIMSTATKSSELSFRKTSVDEGYSSRCPTASPSPSATETPVSFSSKVTSAPKSLEPGSFSLTDMLVSQPIPDILKADLMDTTSEDTILVCENVAQCESVSSIEVDVIDVVEVDTESGDVTNDCGVDPNALLDSQDVDEESTVSDQAETSLVVTIPVSIKNGQICVQGKASPNENRMSHEVIVIDNLTDCSDMDVNVVDVECKPEPQVTVSDYASEEVAITCIPQCTTDQVHKTVSSLLSVALEKHQTSAIQTKSEIETLLSSVAKGNDSVLKTVLMDSTFLDKPDEQEYVHLNLNDLQSILSPKPVCKNIGMPDYYMSEIDELDVGNEVVVGEETSTLCESEDLATLLTNNCFEQKDSTGHCSIQKTLCLRPIPALSEVF